MTRLSMPLSDGDVRALKAGDVVSLSGRLYTGRDKFHKFVAEGGTLPVDFRNGALYHCGPVCVREGVEKWKSGKVEKCEGIVEEWKSRRVEKCEGIVEKWKSGKVEECGGWKVVAAGPTTSVRENAYEPLFIERSGVRVIVGKGGMDEATHAAMQKHGCVYVQAIGGAGAFYASCVRRVAGVSFLREFGAAEAVWHFDVEDFCGIVAMDAHGVSLFDKTRTISCNVLSRLLKEGSKK